MLTVKHVADGHEAIYCAPFGVNYEGPFNQHTGQPYLSIPSGDFDAQSLLGVECRALYGGVAYVMNDSGATVGIYSLGGAPQSAVA